MEYHTQGQGQAELTLSPPPPPRYSFWEVYIISTVGKFPHSSLLSHSEESQPLTRLTRGNKEKLGLATSHLLSTSEGKRVLEEHGLHMNSV